MTDVELILTAIEKSGLSARRFAAYFLARDERTVRRWSAGEIAIPHIARVRLEWFVCLPESERRKLIALLDVL